MTAKKKAPKQKRTRKIWVRRVPVNPRGTLICQLSKVMLARGFTKEDGTPNMYRLHVEGGIDYPTILSLCKTGTGSHFGLVTLLRLCEALDVTPGELLVWVPVEQAAGYLRGRLALAAGLPSLHEVPSYQSLNVATLKLAPSLDPDDYELPAVSRDDGGVRTEW